MLRIGQFSKLAKITVKTLRYYDKIGLLRPAMVDVASSYRYYTEEQLETVYRINAYKEIGLSNEQVLALLQHGEDERVLLEYQRRLLSEREAALHRALSRIDGLLCRTARQTYSACVKQVEGKKVFYCRGYVPSVDSMHDFIKACMTEFFATNPDVRLPEDDYCCIIYPDDGYRESNVFIEYAQSVERYGKETPVLKFGELPPITAVSVLHRGDYDSLREAYLFAVRWAGENGYELAGEPRERYINGAWNREQVSDWLTELQLPIRAREDV